MMRLRERPISAALRSSSGIRSMLAASAFALLAFMLVPGVSGPAKIEQSHGVKFERVLWRNHAPKKHGRGFGFWCGGGGNGAGGGGGGGAFDLAAEIAEIRAHAVYGSAFSSSASPYSGGGLAVPDEPVITQQVTVDSWAALLDEIASGTEGKEITLNSAFSPHTATATATLSDVDSKLIFTGCTVNGPIDQPIFEIYDANGVPERVRIEGGTLNGGIGNIKGRDIHIYNVSATGLMETNAYSSSCGSISGQRVVFERVRIRDYWNGFFFTDALTKAWWYATVSGTTLTVTGTSYGQVAVGDSVNYVTGATGVTIPDGVTITALGTGTGGAGTYTLSEACSWTGTGTFTSRIPSGGLILANSDAECPDAPVGASANHESTTRLNGVYSAVVLKSRVWCTPKASLRAHASYAGLFQASQNVLWKNVQFEDSAIQSNEPGDSGVYPAVGNIWMHGCRGYNASTTVAVQVPYYSQLGTVSVTGNGTTATLTTAGQYVRSGFTAGEVVDITQAINTDFNATGVTLTPTGIQTATYSSTDVGTTVVVVNRTKVVVSNFWAVDNHLYGVGAANDTAWLPTGLGSPHSTWDTVEDATAAYANGNIQYTYVSTPAWEIAE